MQGDSTTNQDEVYENLKKSRFKQQKLPAWRPVPTITSTTITFVSFGIVFIIIGIIVLIYSGKVIEVSKDYTTCTQSTPENGSSNNSECYTDFEIEEEMKKPVMFYYQIDNFYQNHRRYVKSKSDQQLNGKYLTIKQLENSGDCDPVITNDKMNKSKNLKGENLNPSDPAVPCGLIAKSFFTDTFRLVRRATNPENIEINQKDIAWEADKNLKFKNVENPADKSDKEWYKTKQWIDMTDEHFIVWMRPAGLPNFRKLWGRIEQDLPKGSYRVYIVKTWDVDSFGGKVHFILSTVNSFGGKNTFLGISYCVVGGICIILAIIFLIGYQIHQRKEN